MLSFQSRSLRPFVNVWIPADENMEPGQGGESHFVIDDAMDPRSEKFHYLKNFRYTLFGGPESVKLTLFDDQGHLWEIFENFYNTFAGAGEDLASAYKYQIGFRFGWSYFEEGDIVDDRVSKSIFEISSKWHYLTLTDFDCQMTDGGYMYAITGTDHVAPAQQSTIGHVYKDMDYKDAVLWAFTEEPNRQFPKMNPPLFMDEKGDYHTIQGARVSPSQNMPAEIPNMGGAASDALTMLREWTEVNGTLDDKPLTIIFDSEKQCIVIKPMPTGSDMEPNLKGPHLVNTWKAAGYNGTVVTRFEPKLSGLGMLSQALQVGLFHQNQRVEMQTANDPNAQVIGTSEGQKNSGQGKQTQPIATTAPDDPNTAERKAKVKQEVKNTQGNSYGYQTVFTAEAELEMLGWPKSDAGADVIGKSIDLIVWRPYNISWQTKDYYDGELMWHSEGIDTRLTGKWLIREIEHVIDDTVGYRIVAKILRIRGPDSLPFESGQTG
jgi:hypothetical protein